MDAAYDRVFVVSAGIGNSRTFFFKSCLPRAGYILLIIRPCSLWIWGFYSIACLFIGRVYTTIISLGSSMNQSTTQDRIADPF